MMQDDASLAGSAWANVLISCPPERNIWALYPVNYDTLYVFIEFPF